MTINMPGFHFDVPASVYFSDPCPAPSLTQSLCKVLLDRSPAHAMFRHPRLCPQDEPEPEEYREAQAIGSAAHKLLIGRGRDLVLADFDNWRTKDAQKIKADAYAAGKLPILVNHHDRAQEMVDEAIIRLATLGWEDAFQDPGNGEVVIIAQDGSTWLRSLVDWVASPVLLYDYKTSGASLAPHVIGRKAEADGWHIQAAFQERILNLIDPSNAGKRRFRFVAQENSPPWALVGVELDEAWMTMGRKQVDAAIKIWRCCMAMGDWPAYPAFPITPEFPGYREAAWLDREQSEPQFAADHLMAG